MVPADTTRPGQRSDKGANAVKKYVVWFLIGLVVALALAATAAVTNPSSSFPITVDGTTSSTTKEYPTNGSLGYKSGSLYSDPIGGNLATYVVTNALSGQKGDWFCGKIESVQVNADSYIDGQEVARIALTVNRVTKTSTTPAKAELIIGKSVAGFTYNVQLTDSSGVTNNAPADLGMLIAAKVTTGADDNSFPGQKALVTEFAIPLVAGVKTLVPIVYPADNKPYRIVSTYYKPVSGDPIQITDGLVTVKPITTKKPTTYDVVNDAFFVPSQAAQHLVVGNIGSLDPTKNGNVQVTLSGLPADVLNGLSYNKVALRDADKTWSLDFLGVNNIGPGTFYTTGAPVSKASPPKLNADGTVTLTMFFSASDLVNKGQFTYQTSMVEFAAFFNGKSFAAKVPVTISGK